MVEKAYGIRNSSYANHGFLQMRRTDDLIDCLKIRTWQQKIELYLVKDKYDIVVFKQKKLYYEPNIVLWQKLYTK